MAKDFNLSNDARIDVRNDISSKNALDFSSDLASDIGVDLNADETILSKGIKEGVAGMIATVVATVSGFTPLAGQSEDYITLPQPVSIVADIGATIKEGDPAPDNRNVTQYPTVEYCDNPPDSSEDDI